MKSIIILSFLLIGFSFHTEMQAQGCKSATVVVKDIFNNYGKVLTKFGCTLAVPAACLADTKIYSSMTKEMIEYWNDQSGTTQWATIGPRLLEYNKAEKGTLVSTGGRMFITAIPSNKDELTVDIQELDGRAETSVVVCKVDKDGTYFPLATKWFNDTNDRQDKADEQRNFKIEGVKGYLISVHFDAKSVANKFQYTLKIY